MTDLFAKRREKLLAMRAKRDKQGTLKSTASVICPSCKERILKSGLSVCPHCKHHMAMGAYERLHSILDSGSFRELTWRESWLNFDFPNYREKLESLQECTGISEAVVCATGTIDGNSCVVAVMDSRFMMGSMGTVVGERIVRSIEYSAAKRIPLIIFTASGGARMQEGILSLMQMAKTSAALAKLAERAVPYIVVLTNPTTGGVTASFASLGDIILAEPKALIGFAGPRVIEQTIGETLPDGFQSAEFLYEHGFIDAIVSRENMRTKLAEILKLHKRGGKFYE